MLMQEAWLALSAMQDLQELQLENRDAHPLQECEREIFEESLRKGETNREMTESNREMTESVCVCASVVQINKINTEQIQVQTYGCRGMFDQLESQARNDGQTPIPSNAIHEWGLPLRTEISGR